MRERGGDVAEAVGMAAASELAETLDVTVSSAEGAEDGEDP